jgi:hypothetical protein
MNSLKSIGGEMGTVHLAHPGIVKKVLMLKALRQAKKAITSQEKALSDEVKDSMEEFGLGEYSLESDDDGLHTFSFIEAERVSLSKTMLLEAGVHPDLVKECMTATRYRYIGPIKQNGN